MKIVGYEEFIRMPAGTIFAPFTPNFFEEGFEIKVDEGHEYIGQWDDEKHWAFLGTMPLEPWLACDDSMTYGEYDVKLEIYDGDSTDAMHYKMFAVLEPHDVKELINALYWALDGCEANTHHNYKEQEK